ncbi:MULTISPECIES: nickel/cobalt ABC transporter permease [Sporomusa]|jgi:nickel transport system permease protein|uniref:Glutathione transport system permease protein GsiD n=2 Tax=Sporomusa TaxID=2375 RepID=A0ABM9W011_9FIRM|nr:MULTISPECIES: nickel/cobalt ABC transporter permease [Sporomusa]OLS57096.1 nickel transport system permease protein NikC [Sporomusa sphaeroides DSM 2875]CVK18282.1 Glutathione transport system permease protein GsiD [Sporomusa sphaeroides DSM 2875]SCM81614.1 nickel transporter subunit; membrane component of ABC superfamily [uncultured Sporomusa sp.]HML31808.1 ABC transporter permease subunit [Sporomusa sphaeroides]
MRELCNRLFRDYLAMGSLGVIGLTLLAGLFAPWLALHDPNQVDVLHKYAGVSSQYPLGADQLGRCIYSRLLYGIRTTVFLSLLTMAATITVGVFFGLLAGSFRGWVDEGLMRFADVMLSFPSQVMILAIVGMLGVGIGNVILANIIVKWAWYTRMVRSTVLKYSQKNYILFSRATGSGKSFILFKHLLPNVAPEIIVLATLDTGWVILNLSALSFLGLGVQAPTAEWGAMLSEAQKVMTIHPEQMLAPGLAILALVAAFNLLGDSLRDALDPKEGCR